MRPPRAPPRAMPRLTVGRRAPRLPVALGAAVLLAAALHLAMPLIGTSSAQGSTAQIGYRGPGYASSRFSRATGEKPESKLWWNDGFWWADLYHDPTHAHHIYRLNLDTMAWEDTGVELDDRNKAKSDILWDEASGKLYVVSHKGSDTSALADEDEHGRLYRYTYLRDQRTYQLDAGFPITITPGLTQSLTIAKDSTGQLWISYVWGSEVVVNHSLGDDRTWGAPYPLPVLSRQTSAEDLAAVIAFGGDKIGVAWGDQWNDTVNFAVHHDGTGDGEWQQEMIVGGNRMADNHLNLATDRFGNVYLVTKTAAKRLADPLILLHVRTEAGVWSSHVFSVRQEKHTRPIVLVDDENRDVYVFATAPERGGTIYYKRAHLEAIEFEPGLGTPIVRYPGASGLNDVTSTKQPVTGQTQLVILASDSTTQTYYYNLLPLRQGDSEMLP